MKTIKKIILRDINDGTTVEINGPSHPIINTIQSTINDPVKFHNSVISSCMSVFNKPFFIEQIIYND